MFIISFFIIPALIMATENYNFYSQITELGVVTQYAVPVNENPEQLIICFNQYLLARQETQINSNIIYSFFHQLTNLTTYVCKTYT
jgi:hypothetical protein